MNTAQIHALEKAVMGLGDLLFEHGTEPESNADYLAARSALAACWSDYRAARRQAVPAPRRALQRVGAK
jgi:hypothetical protein